MKFCLSVLASLLQWVVYGRDLKFQMIRICFSVVGLSWNWHHTIFQAINIPMDSQGCVYGAEKMMELKNWATKLRALSYIFHNHFVKMTYWDYQEGICICLPYNFLQIPSTRFFHRFIRKSVFSQHYKGQIG